MSNKYTTIPSSDPDDVSARSSTSSTSSPLRPLDDASNPSTPRTSVSSTRTRPMTRDHAAHVRSTVEPPVAGWKRAALIAFMAFLFYLAIKLGSMGLGGDVERHKENDPANNMAGWWEDTLRKRFGTDEIVHAKRYDAKHKYRPAASPVITERTKDGRLRLRGATPGGTL